MSKNEVLFASADHITASLREFNSVLRTHTAASRYTKKSLAEDFAVIHCEINAIHPFREGNGRTIRLFLDLLALRVGYDFIDWSRSSQEKYIHACIAGMAKRYSFMQRIVYKGLVKRATI